MEVSSIVILYFEKKIFVRYSEVPVLKSCPIIEVPLQSTYAS